MLPAESNLQLDPAVLSGRSSTTAKPAKAGNDAGRLAESAGIKHTDRSVVVDVVEEIRELNADIQVVRLARSPAAEAAHHAASAGCDRRTAALSTAASASAIAAAAASTAIPAALIVRSSATARVRSAEAEVTAEAHINTEKARGLAVVSRNDLVRIVRANIAIRRRQPDLTAACGQ